MSYADESEQDAIIRDDQIRWLRNQAADANERARRWNLLADAIAEGLIERLDEEAARLQEQADQAEFLERTAAAVAYSGYDELTEAQIGGASCAKCGGKFFRDQAHRPTGEHYDGYPLFAHPTCLDTKTEASL